MIIVWEMWNMKRIVAAVKIKKRTTNWMNKQRKFKM